MNTRKSKTASSMAFLEKLTGGPLTLGSLIRAIRQGEEMSQIDFAGLLGISKSHLCDIEKGRKPVSPAKAKQYAHVLGYSEEQFVELALQDQVNRLGLAFEVQLRRSKKAA